MHNISWEKNVLFVYLTQGPGFIFIDMIPDKDYDNVLDTRIIDRCYGNKIIIRYKEINVMIKIVSLKSNMFLIAKS